MTPTPVASIPKEIAAAAANPLPVVNPAPAASFDFSQLLASNDSAPVQPPAGTTNTSLSPDGTQVHSFHLKRRAEEADATNAAAALPVPPALAQLLAAKGTANSGTATPSTGTTPQTPLAVLPPAAAQTGTGTNSDSTAQNGQSAPQALGAAGIEARIAVGAPTYLSQPNTMLAGLWHHQSPAANGAEPGTANTDSDADATAPAAAAGNGASAPILSAKLAALQSAAAGAPAHDGQNDSSLVAPADAAAATAALGDATGNAAATTGAPATATLPVPDGSTTQNTTIPQTPGAQPAAAAQALPAYEQVAVSLRQAAQAGTDRIEIQLKPASLGAIHVKLDVTHDGHISAVISADRSDTLNMLRQDSSGLEQALRNAGLQTDSGSLSFNLRGDGQSFAQASQSQGTASSANDGGSAASSGSDTPQPRYRRHDGALDIEV